MGNAFVGLGVARTVGAMVVGALVTVRIHVGRSTSRELGGRGRSGRAAVVGALDGLYGIQGYSTKRVSVIGVLYVSGIRAC